MYVLAESLSSSVSVLIVTCEAFDLPLELEGTLWLFGAGFVDEVEAECFLGEVDEADECVGFFGEDGAD